MYRANPALLDVATHQLERSYHELLADVLGGAATANAIERSAMFRLCEAALLRRYQAVHAPSPLRSGRRRVAAWVYEAVMVARVVDRERGRGHAERLATIEHHGQLFRA
jgi:hypothetical protein